MMPSLVSTLAHAGYVAYVVELTVGANKRKLLTRDGVRLLAVAGVATLSLVPGSLGDGATVAAIAVVLLGTLAPLIIEALGLRALQALVQLGARRATLEPLEVERHPECRDVGVVTEIDGTQMRGAARDYQVPRDMRTPDALRPAVASEDLATLTQVPGIGRKGAQRIVLERLLPIPRLEGTDAGGPAGGYLYEPEPEDIFRDLLPRHVHALVYRALLESNAAFYAAQMTAMDAATRNSGEMIESLTLYMNKVRQAAITREIIEVVSGAAAT